MIRACAPALRIVQVGLRVNVCSCAQEWLAVRMGDDDDGRKLRSIWPAGVPVDNVLALAGFFSLLQVVA